MGTIIRGLAQPMRCLDRGNLRTRIALYLEQVVHSVFGVNVDKSVVDACVKEAWKYQHIGLEEVGEALRLAEKGEIAVSGKFGVAYFRAALAGYEKQRIAFLEQLVRGEVRII